MNYSNVLALSPLYSLQFVVIKEHENLRNGDPPVAPRDGQAAVADQFFSLEPGK